MSGGAKERGRGSRGPAKLLGLPRRLFGRRAVWGSPGLQAPQTSRSLLSAFLSCKAPIFLASLPPMAPFCESLWPLFCLQGLPDSTVFSVWNRFCHLRVLEFRHVSPPASDYSPIKRRGWFLFWLMGLLASGKTAA